MVAIPPYAHQALIDTVQNQCNLWYHKQKQWMVGLFLEEQWRESDWITFFGDVELKWFNAWENDS